MSLLVEIQIAVFPVSRESDEELSDVEKKSNTTATSSGFISLMMMMMMTFRGRLYAQVSLWSVQSRVRYSLEALV